VHSTAPVTQADALRVTFSDRINFLRFGFTYFGPLRTAFVNHRRLSTNTMPFVRTIGRNVCLSFRRFDSLPPADRALLSAEYPWPGMPRLMCALAHLLTIAFDAITDVLVHAIERACDAAVNAVKRTMRYIRDLVWLVIFAAVMFATLPMRFPYGLGATLCRFTHSRTLRCKRYCCTAVGNVTQPYVNRMVAFSAWLRSPFQARRRTSRARSTLPQVRHFTALHHEAVPNVH
jgi:hypothetical protein